MGLEVVADMSDMAVTRAAFIHSTSFQVGRLDQRRTVGIRGAHQNAIMELCFDL